METTHQKSLTCIACAHQAEHNIHHATENMFGMKDEFQYLECSSCGSLQILEVPKDLSIYYPSSYYAFGGLKNSSFPKNILKKLRWFAANILGINFTYPEYLHWLKKLKANYDDRIADIGCGNGQLIYELYQSGFNNVFGFDPFLNQEMNKSGIQLQRKELAAVDGKYDILMMHHSFEHIENPHFAFQVLDKLSTKGTRLLLRLPISDCWAWETHGVFWFQLDAPRHLFIPSKEALVMMAKKYGFELMDIEFDSNANQFWGPELYKKGLPYHGTPLDKAIGISKLDEYSIKAMDLNRQKIGDQACFYFEKVI